MHTHETTYEFMVGDLDAAHAEELAAREGPGYVNAATGYLANFRQDVQPMSTGGVLLPSGD
ncbi:hypothetical protein D3C83_94820 [compost metagenome]